MKYWNDKVTCTCFDLYTCTQIKACASLSFQYFTQVIECNAQMSIRIRHCETTVMVIRSLNGKVIANVVDYLEAVITTTLTGCLPMHRLLYGLPQSVIGYSPGDVIMARKTGIKQFLTI